MALKCCMHGTTLRRASAGVVAITLVVALLGTFGAPASAGSFQPAGALNTGRYYHTATTLPDGRVLVAGGNRPSGQSFTFVGAAELYDPATNAWTSAGTLAPALAYHAATLLPSGKVLLIGGCEPTEAAPPQVYDPATNTWSYAGATVPLPRLYPTATLLADGRVLVVGGVLPPFGSILKSAELFDPATNTWSPVPDLARERTGHRATLLPSGKVLVTGGVDAQSVYIATAELYDPVTNTWSSAGTLAHARGGHSATLLPDQTVLVVAGSGPIQRPFMTVTGYLSSAETYAPSSNTWTSTSTAECEAQSEDSDPPPVPGCLANPRTGHTATLLADGTVLAAGGLNLDRDGSAEIYHPASRTWSAAGAMSSPRELHATTLLKDGRALIVGGWNTYGVGTLASAEIYAPTPLPPGTLSVLRSGPGNVTSNPAGIACGSDCGETYPSGTGVTLTAAPLSGSTFSGWGGDCSAYGTQSTCTLDMNAARNVTASFAPQSPPTTFALTVSKAGSGIGTVTSNSPGIACGADCSESYAPGTSVNLTAAPLAGSGFSGWGGACAGTGTCAVSMSSDRNVAATFAYTGSAYSFDYVQKAFVAYYGRPADPGGQAYWAGRMDVEGQSLNAIIGAFGYSDEFNRRYGGLTYRDLVTKIYQQALGRDPDLGGLDWYVMELEAGRRTLQSITLDVLNGATTAPDSAAVANKLDVAAYYTGKVTVGCAYGTEQDGVDVLAMVTALDASVADAKADIDAGCGP